jgi:hypothetical protein
LARGSSSLCCRCPVLAARGELLEAIKKQEEALETIYSSCGWLAFFLYVFGWSQSLYGSPSGNGVPGDEK